MEAKTILEILSNAYKTGFEDGYIEASSEYDDLYDDSIAKRDFKNWKNAKNIMEKAVEKTKKKWIKKYNL